MAKEIERKYLVKDDRYKSMSQSHSIIRQGYLSRRPEATVRVRIRDGRGYLTVKGLTRGATRDEWEYPVPVADAEAMLEVCEGTVIDKTRWLVEYRGHVWEVDEFRNPHPGLVVAEVELRDAGESVTLPPFVGDEVTGNPAYYNSNL